MILENQLYWRHLRFSLILIRSNWIFRICVYTPDFLTGKKEKNCGQLAMYLVEGAHEPIIEPTVFEKVREMKGCIKLPKISEPAEQEWGDALTMKGSF